MTATVILNPYANRWRARARRAEVESALRDAGISFDLIETTAPNEAIEIAKDSVRVGRTPVIAAGGDGTYGEVINGLFRAHPEGTLGPVGVLPLGTANDLMANLGLPMNLREAAAVIAGGHTRRIDLGMANEWLFDNNSAVGLEPVVTIKNTQIRRLRGVGRYLVAALQAIAEKPEWEMKLKWDGGSYEGPVSLVSVGNCPRTGGLFRMAPAADPSDGMLTFVYGYAPTRRKMLSLLPRAISGNYVQDAAIHQHHTRELVIEASPSTPIQIDGELRSLDLVHIHYRVLPARLDIFAP
jgi:diacylglycerol kinase (ATP)